MAKMHITITIEADLLEKVKATNVNLSGLVNELLTKWLQVREASNPISQASQDYDERISKIVAEFAYDGFYAIKSKYAEKLIRQALQKQGYTAAEIQTAYEIAKKQYEAENANPTNTNVEITLTPANEPANDNNKSANVDNDNANEAV